MSTRILNGSFRWKKNIRIYSIMIIIINVFDVIFNFKYKSHMRIHKPAPHVRFSQLGLIVSGVTRKRYGSYNLNL